MALTTSSPTIKDIAARAGVSISTVHYALRGTRPISEETRERVLQAIADLDYHPHSGAATLPSGRTGRLAVVIAGIEPAFANTYFSDFIRGVAGAAEAEDHTVVLYTAYGRRVADGWRPSHIFRRREADGLIVMGTQLAEDHLRELADSGRPCVLLNREFRGLASITADRAQGAHLATSHLLRAGRRPVGLLAAQYPGGGPEIERPELVGYRTALAETGERFYPHLASFAPVGESADAAIDDLLRTLLEWSHSRRDSAGPALLAFTYTLAPFACRAIARYGMRVPDELAVVLGDEDPESRDGLDVPLTGVRARKFEMAQAATSLLLRQVRGEPISEGERNQRIPMEITVRWSCGARGRLSDDDYGEVRKNSAVEYVL